MIAIFGANGFIGRHLTDILKDQDLKLFARNYDSFPFPLPGTAITADFSKPSDYIASLEGCRAAVLLVTASFVRAAADPSQDILDNVSPYRDFLAALKNLKKPPEHLVYLSSGGAIYGRTELKPISETHPLNPTSSYGKAKLEIEKLIEKATRTAPWRYSILRVANPVGVWCKRGALVDNALKAARSGPALKIFGDGSMVRDYFDVRELAACIAQLLDKPAANEIYNTGSSRGTTINEIVEIVGDIAGKKVPVEYIAANAVDVPYNVLDCTKIKNAAGWQAKNSLKDIVKTMWNEG